ncbi:MAG: ABC transporter ATP-binding protein, partial [Pseudothermotoga sp.]
GKSTLLRLIASVLKPSSGTIKLNGQSIYQVREYFQMIGFVMQYAEDSFCCDTVFEEIAFASKNFGLDGVEERVVAAARLVGLNDICLSSSPYELSSGEARRVAIASVLAHDPFLLILDEPFVGLDKEGKIAVRKILEKYKALDRAIVVVSHQISYLKDLINQGFVLENGSLLPMKWN